MPLAEDIAERSDHPTAVLPGDPARLIVIAGAGFSGTMAAIHLRRRLPRHYTICLVERTGRFARGLAYARSDAPYLLNVRAANMSAFPDDPGHFERWIVDIGEQFPAEIHRTEAGIFATRRLYGRYLRGLLYQERKAAGGGVQLIVDDVTALRPASSGWVLGCGSGREIAAAGVVLAMGNASATRPCDDVVFHNPWTPGAVSGLRQDEPVLIIGTSLTMADLALAIRERGFRGPITALSRRGLVPHRHALVDRPWPAPSFTSAERHSVLALLRRVRAEIEQARSQGVDWRAVIDGLRPITASLWQGFDAEQRRRFLRHLRPYWDVHRHRMAPFAADDFAQLRELGALRIVRGYLREVRQLRGGAAVTVQQGETGAIETSVFQRVIFATGLDTVRPDHGLVAQLLDDRIARPGPQGLGLDATEALEVISARGEPAPLLWALGPILRGVFWECLAVPDIRMQAQLLGEAVTAQLASADAATP